MDKFIKRLLDNDAINLTKLSKAFFFVCFIPSMICYFTWGIWGKELISQYFVAFFGLLSVPYLGELLKSIDGKEK